VTQSISWYLDMRQSIASVANALSVSHLAFQSSLLTLAKRISVDPSARREINGSRFSPWRGARLKKGITIGLGLCHSPGVGADVPAAPRKAESRGNIMRCGLKALIAFVLVTMHVFAEAKCLDGQIERTILQNPSGAIVEGVACGTSETTGEVAITLLVNEERRAVAHTTYESNAYVLAIDTAIRFGNDNEQGLGVSTGKGRAGNGMHYWKIPKTSMQLIDLGEAPALTRDRLLKNTYSALLSSSGDYQSVRYFYEVRNNALVLIKAIGFSMPNSKSFIATDMRFGKNGQTILHGKRKLSPTQGAACMDGKIKCW
jgi:hypothetical protein